MLNFKICAAAILAAGLFASSAHANTLTLVQTVADDVTTPSVAISYNVGGVTPGLFSVTGTTKQLNASMVGFAPGSFTLNAYLTSSGAIDPNKLNLDSLDIFGGSGSSNLLYHSTQLLAFGFDPVNANFQFIFGSTTSPVSTYSNLGLIGVKLNGSMPSYTGVFTGAFSTPVMSFENADTFTVAPLPPAVFMGLSLLAGSALLARRQRA